MGRKFRLSYVFLLLSFLQNHLSSCFSKNIGYSRKAIENKVHNEEQEINNQSLFEIFPETEDERIDKNKLIRKKRFINLSNSAIENYENSEEDQSNLKENNLFELKNSDEDDIEEEGNEQENLNRSKRECEQNLNFISAKKSPIKREAEYEDSIDKIDDSNIEEESAEDESKIQSETRFKRNEENSDQDYEKELKSKAKVEKLEKNNAVKKRNTDKKLFLENQLSEPEMKNRQIQKRSNNDYKFHNLKENNLYPFKSDDKFDKKLNKVSGISKILNLDVKDDESDDDYEKRVAEQIQQKIDAMKEEIKREVEENQKIEEIEENNAKYDELQNQDENMDQNQNSNNQEINWEKSLVKRNSNLENSKRQVVKKRKRLKLANHQNHQSSNLKENMDSRHQKVQIHESIRKRSAPEYGDVDSHQDFNTKNLYHTEFNNKENNTKTVSFQDKENQKQTRISIPEQPRINIEEKIPQDLFQDQKLELDSSSLKNDKPRLKRSSSWVSLKRNKRQRIKNLVPGEKFRYLKYRPQNNDDDNDDEGNEFEDDGFDDQTSNLDERGSSDLRNSVLFNNRNQLTKRKPAQLAFAKDTKKRRCCSRKKKRKKRTSVKMMNERDKSEIENSQELNSRLASDYKEAFGGHQGYPNGALTRFKRIKRVLRGS